MSQNAASPIIDLVDKAYTTAENFLNKIPTPGYKARKPDTSWHDEMVKEANASFAAQAKNPTSHQKNQSRINSKYRSR